MDGIINAGKITNQVKLTATNALLSAINKLYDKSEKGDSEAIQLANKIQSSEFYKTIKSFADAAECESFVMAETAENLLELADKIECSISGTESEEQPFNAFDSMRTMVSNLPIRYVVDNVLVSTMENSTTTIPYSVVLTPVDSPYMGVDNWGKYLYNLMITSMGKISSPWHAQIFGAPDDLTGYDDAVDYVKQVESQIAAYSVHKGANTKFEAWIERASTAKAGAVAYTSGASDGSFLLETENETAAYVDSKLTFTGNAVLEVTALSAEDGVLCIKDDEGNVKRIEIDVVEAHTCHSDTWHVELAPTEEYDGYRAKYCDICGDTIAVDVLTVCSEHNFGEWIVEQEPTEESMGIQYRECQNCGARETEYLPASEEPGSDIVSVDIEWGAMNYTYSDGTWNTSTHSYDGGGWSDGGSGYVKVVNNGTVNATAGFTFASDRKEISGSFTDGTNVITDPVDVAAGQSQTTFLLLSGKPTEELSEAKIGTVTVRIGGE